MVLIVKFCIAGNLRFLSHSETLRTFHRACQRAGLPLRYSRGFNPRPKISLPCPRSVGIEAFDEVLIVELDNETLRCSKKSLVSYIQQALLHQLPDGCDLISITCYDEKVKLRPREVMYLMHVKKKYSNDALRMRINTVLSEEHLFFRRYKDGKREGYKDLDLRPFVKSIDYHKNDDGTVDISIACRVSTSGTVRVDELLMLLGLDIEEMKTPIQRTHIEWN